MNSRAIENRDTFLSIANAAAISNAVLGILVIPASVLLFVALPAELWFIPLSLLPLSAAFFSAWFTIRFMEQVVYQLVGIREDLRGSDRPPVATAGRSTGPGAPALHDEAQRAREQHQRDDREREERRIAARLAELKQAERDQAHRDRLLYLARVRRIALRVLIALAFLIPVGLALWWLTHQILYVW